MWGYHISTISTLPHTTNYRLAASRQEEHFRIDSLSFEDRSAIPRVQGDFVNNKYSAHLQINKKLNVRNTVNTGVILDLYDFDLANDHLVPGTNG